MSVDPHEYEMEEAMMEFLDEELRRISEEPVFAYLAENGDAIEKRVRDCMVEASQLLDAGFAGAALARTTAATELTIKFFLVRPLLQGAFLSDDWAQVISRRVLKRRTGEDRELLPAILRNWQIDITNLKLPDGSQVWETITAKVWPLRNEYVHKGASCGADDAKVAIECQEALLRDIVNPLANRLGFTREKTGKWSVVAANDPPGFEGLNRPRRYTERDPFAVE